MKLETKIERFSTNCNKDDLTTLVGLMTAYNEENRWSYAQNLGFQKAIEFISENFLKMIDKNT